MRFMHKSGFEICQLFYVVFDMSFLGSFSACSLPLGPWHSLLCQVHKSLNGTQRTKGRGRIQSLCMRFLGGRCFCCRENLACRWRGFWNSRMFLLLIIIISSSSIISSIIRTKNWSSKFHSEESLLVPDPMGRAHNMGSWGALHNNFRDSKKANVGRHIFWSTLSLHHWSHGFSCFMT